MVNPTNILDGPWIIHYNAPHDQETFKTACAARAQNSSKHAGIAARLRRTLDANWFRGTLSSARNTVTNQIDFFAHAPRG